LKIVVISDTHGRHDRLEIPSGDLIIHAGDVSMRGFKTEVEAFLHWYSNLDFKYKIFIAGNHDFFFQDNNRDIIDAIIPSDITYLEDESVEVEGIKIWGSPISPWFHDWAFNRQRGYEIKQHWDKIPIDTNIVVTHGPVYGVLDKTKRGDKVGCVDLLEKINIVSPKYHICGHIHEDYGMVTKEETCFINASILNLQYEVANAPVVFDY
jgi:Icc-related predicted phosphoesterase